MRSQRLRPRLAGYRRLYLPLPTTRLARHRLMRLALMLGLLAAVLSWMW